MRDQHIFYSWDRILKHCNNNTYKILQVFKTAQYRQFPGNSFLLNPEPLFNLHSIYDTEVVEYIALASLRNYFDAEYLHNAKLYAPYIYPIDINKLKTNRLLKLVGEEILFRFEEEYGNQVW